MKSSVGKKGQCIFVNIFEQMNIQYTRKKDNDIRGRV